MPRIGSKKYKFVHHADTRGAVTTWTWTLHRKTSATAFTSDTLAAQDVANKMDIGLDELRHGAVGKHRDFVARKIGGAQVKISWHKRRLGWFFEKDDGFSPYYWTVADAVAAAKTVPIETLKVVRVPREPANHTGAIRRYKGVVFHPQKRASPMHVRMRMRVLIKLLTICVFTLTVYRSRWLHKSC